ncbi:MAG: hypothetical protein JWO52_6944 [Gammaproteobacteria bacterium]|nr:hypothetical protein [Gammaproteobacteria bacterium]
MWLQVDPAEEESDSYKITWGKRLPYPISYSVEKARLHTYAAQLRNALQALADGYANPPDDVERRNRLVALASAGRDFEDQLFFWPQRRGDIRSLRSYLEREFATNDKSLEVRAPASLQVPWGVVYTGDPPRRILEDNAPAGMRDLKDLGQERKLFENFWCLRYQELSITRGTFFRAQCEMLRPKQNFGILPLLNSEVEKQVHHNVENGCETLEHELFAGSTRSHERCLEAITHTGFRDIIFYFLGHHRNSSLQLSDEMITDAMFGRLMERLAETIASGPASSCGLVFLNACESAYGEGFSLRSYTESPELCGTIATESRIPIPDAHKLGVRLLHLLKIDGKSVGQALRMISDDPNFWPLCLMYGRYASPDYAIQST